MNETKPREPGFYLVGRLDGGVEPFFARVLEANGQQMLQHNQKPGIIKNLRAYPEVWWWEFQHIPSGLPREGEI